MFGAWLDADVAGRKAGQGNRAAGLVARAARGDQLTNQEKAEVRIVLTKQAEVVARETRPNVFRTRGFSLPITMYM